MLDAYKDFFAWVSFGFEEEDVVSFFWRLD
jgi:hypothetical protein